MSANSIDVLKRRLQYLLSQKESIEKDLDKLNAKITDYQNVILDMQGFSANQNLIDTSIRFNWKKKIITFFEENPEGIFTTKEIFDIIYPDAKLITPKQRRVKIVGASFVIGNLVRSRKIFSYGSRNKKYSLTKFKNERT